MGKTAKGAVWLDPAKTTPFEFYQYWRNIDDADVMKCIRMLTFIPIEEIDEIDKWAPERINEKKELLAFELTKLVHGDDEAKKAQDAAHALFAGGGDDSNMPTTELSDVPAEGLGIIDLLVTCKLAPSRGEARRLIQQGGITVDEVKIEAIDHVITKDALTAGVKIRKGKKVYHRAVIR
jgi:tyrosyl-tRNA synthetase